MSKYSLFTLKFILHIVKLLSFRRYLFGESVAGMAYVVFGVMSQTDEEADSASSQKTSLPSSLQKVAVSKFITSYHRKNVCQVKSDSSVLMM